MKSYIESIIDEQTNRALSLKKLIPRPIKYPTLLGLAERCGRILDEQMEALTHLKSELSLRPDDDIRDIFRLTRMCVRDISLVEYYGISALYYQTEEVGFLNNLIFKIHQEIKLPFNHPSVCCTSNNYYYSFLFTNVIFVPLGEAEFLLHLPDLYHELGHCVLGNMENELRLKTVRENYELAASKITNHYIDLLKAKKREAGPEQIPFSIERIHSQWKYWLDEFFCDLFALYTVGPAYAWSHLHLTTKISPDIHSLSILMKQTHPADEARMKILFIGLELLDLKDEATQIQTRWNEITRLWPKPQSMYQYAYPINLLKDIAYLVLEAIKQSGFAIADSKNLSDRKTGNEIRILLNEAWDRFWRKTGEEFRTWEEEQIKLLKNSESKLISN